jgi:hypothetical protein
MWTYKYTVFDGNFETKTIWHTFRIIEETVKLGGWAKARLIRIIEKSEDHSSVVFYNPEIHNEQIAHYMSQPYTTRLTKRCDEDGNAQIMIYWGDGIRYATRDREYEREVRSQEEWEDRLHGLIDPP